MKSIDGRQTYVNFPNTQQFVLVKGLMVVQPGLHLGLTGIDHEGVLFIPRSRKSFYLKEVCKMCNERTTSYTPNPSTKGR